MSWFSNLRRLFPALALLALAGLAACSPFRESGSLDRGVSVTAYTVDNGAGAAVTVADVRMRGMNPVTGVRDGGWRDAIHVLPGPSNGPVAIQALAGVAAAGINATGAVLAADRLGCGRNCGGSGGVSAYFESPISVSGAEAGSYSGSNSTAGANLRANIGSGGSGGHSR